MSGLEPPAPAFSVLSDASSPDYGANTLHTTSSKRVHKEAINLNHTNSKMDFINKLDAKLKNLEEDDKKNKKKKKSSLVDHRPMFITTVKTGIFLDPPPELAALLGFPRSDNVSSGSTASQKSGEDLMYSFSSQPRVLNNKPKPKINNDRQQQVNLEKQRAKNNNLRAKREITNNNANIIKKDERTIPYGNVMYDRRVVRGPAFMHHPTATVGTESQAARQAEARRRAIARRKAQTQRARSLRLRLGTPPPIEGRCHANQQTQDYLEELFDHPPEATVCTQTDFFLDRPPSPVYVPQKIGIDVHTQVYPGELFHFDTEVRPILEVLVGKTLEQSLMEVLEEDELDAIHKETLTFRDHRDTEMAEIQRHENVETRRADQAKMRIREEEDALLQQKETEDRVAAAVLTTGYIADLLPSVVQGLKDAGYIYEEVKDDIEGNFMTWLMDELKTEMQKMIENRDLLSEMLREILESRARVYKALGDRATEKIGAEDEDILTESERPPSLNQFLGEGEMEEEILFLPSQEEDDETAGYSTGKDTTY